MFDKVSDLHTVRYGVLSSRCAVHVLHRVWPGALQGGLYCSWYLLTWSLSRELFADLSLRRNVIVDIHFRLNSCDYDKCSFSLWLYMGPLYKGHIGPASLSTVERLSTLHK